MSPATTAQKAMGTIVPLNPPSWAHRRGRPCRGQHGDGYEQPIEVQLERWDLMPSAGGLGM